MKRNKVIDFLRIFAIVGVLSNHLFYPVFSRHDFLGGASWWLALVIYTISLTAVPIFIMISGYILIDKSDPIEKTLKRVTHKLLVPLIFWFGFYLLWKNKYRSVKFTGPEVLEMILSGNMVFYFFLVILIGLYLVLPLAQLVAKRGSKKLKFLILYLSVGVAWAIGATEYFGNLRGAVLSLTTWWVPYFSYFWWGYMSKKINFRKPAWLSTPSWLSAPFISWTIFTLYLGYMGILLKTVEFDVAFENGIFYWHHYLSPTVWIMSAGLFTWATHSEWLQRLTVRKIISWFIYILAPLTYGAYLIHIFVIDWVDINHRYAIEFVDQSLFGFMLVRPLLSIGLTFAVVLVMSKLPVVKKLVGI